ncbi:UNKNOWN [Stylonychia lemnae]|uniref:Uncharacterized protein n=1 Tax=Stylonychia lemnae TaxID=5949 RepID=A0A078A948_STYLE|nr:UNKNOWN [Stylonychia lemnae]|eukprot:CDW78087.1 UNKNOWN [Stylonychia lemnae]
MKRPFLNRGLNDVEQISLTTTMITIYCGLFFLTSKNKNALDFDPNKDFTIDERGQQCLEKIILNYMLLYVFAVGKINQIKQMPYRYDSQKKFLQYRRKNLERKFEQRQKSEFQSANQLFVDFDFSIPSRNYPAIAPRIRIKKVKGKPFIPGAFSDTSKMDFGDQSSALENSSHHIMKSNKEKYLSSRKSLHTNEQSENSERDILPQQQQQKEIKKSKNFNDPKSINRGRINNQQDEFELDDTSYENSMMSSKLLKNRKIIQQNNLTKFKINFNQHISINPIKISEEMLDESQMPRYIMNLNNISPLNIKNLNESPKSQKKVFFSQLQSPTRLPRDRILGQLGNQMEDFSYISDENYLDPNNSRNLRKMQTQINKMPKTSILKNSKSSFVVENITQDGKNQYKENEDKASEKITPFDYKIFRRIQETQADLEDGKSMIINFKQGNFHILIVIIGEDILKRDQSKMQKMRERLRQLFNVSDEDQELTDYERSELISQYNIQNDTEQQQLEDIYQGKGKLIGKESLIQHIMHSSQYNVITAEDEQLQGNQKQLLSGEKLKYKMQNTKQEKHALIQQKKPNLIDEQQYLNEHITDEFKQLKDRYFEHPQRHFNDQVFEQYKNEILNKKSEENTDKTQKTLTDQDNIPRKLNILEQDPLSKKYKEFLKQRQNQIQETSQQKQQSNVKGNHNDHRQKKKQKKKDRKLREVIDKEFKRQQDQPNHIIKKRIVTREVSDNMIVNEREIKMIEQLDEVKQLQALDIELRDDIFN